MMRGKIGVIIRIVAIVFMGLTAVMNILGGAGTVCAAFLTAQFPPMLPLLEYRWLYQLIMIVTIGLGLGGVWATVRLIQGRPQAYRHAVILLASGTVVSGIQVIASLALRGKAVPANMKLYANALTLALFLLLGLPGIRERVDFSSDPGESARDLTSGLTAFLCGAMVSSTALWVGDSHVHEGVNWVGELRGPLIISGSALLVSGVYRLAPLVRNVARIVITRTVHLAHWDTGQTIGPDSS